MEVFILNWSDEDVETLDDTLDYTVSIWGVTKAGELVCVRTHERPFFYVRARDIPGVSETEVAAWCKRMLQTFGGFHQVKLVEGKPFTGYQESTETFVKLVFNSQKGMRYASKAIRTTGVSACSIAPTPTYETHVPPILRAMHRYGVNSTGWCTVKGTPCSDKTTLADVEFEDPEVAPLESDDLAPAVVATFDIEVYSSKSTREDPVFPSALNEEDVIVTVYSTVDNPEPFYEHVLTLQAEDLDSYPCVVCESERQLLDLWAQEIVKRKATIWVHFNGLGFDEEYMYLRAVRVGAQELLHMGWVANRQEPIELRKSTMESAAYGHNAFAYMIIEGVFHLDLMVAIKKDFNLQSYSLNYCGEHFCKESKIDLPPQKQFDLYRAGRMREVLDYCVQDVRLTLRIATKLSMVTSLVEMAGQTSVPVDFLVVRGQQIKMLSSILRLTAPRNYFLLAADPNQTNDEETYKGATVLDPTKGAYFTVVACLDFASLYPSIMRAHNLSHETWVRDPANTKVQAETAIMPNGEVFVQKPTGILTLLLEKWASDRKLNKKKMMHYEKLAHETNSEHHKFMEKVYDARQKANKVCMNSLYGFCGVAKRGMQSCPEIASTVTTVGRQMIEHTKQCCERMLPGSQVIYGDSVSADTPLLVRRDGTVEFVRIDELFDQTTDRDAA